MTTFDFKNFGYLIHKLSDEELKPIKDEIKSIKDKNFIDSKPANSILAGNIKNEFYLKDCLNHVESIILPLINEYDKDFNYLQTIQINTMAKPYGLDKLWVNFMKKNEFNPIHNHSGIFSFVIWIDVPYDIKDEMNHESSMYSNTNLAGHFSFIFQNILGNTSSLDLPVDKTYNAHIMLFPAKLPHCVYPFKSTDAYRISVSGNVSIKI